MTKQNTNFAIDWGRVGEAMQAQGYAVIPPFLSRSLCEQIRSFYDDPGVSFRSTINMARYNFGRGEYKDFAYPLPEPVQQLRAYFYENLAPIANQWERCFGREPSWPENLAQLTEHCHQHNQYRPTPLLLRYEEHDYNCLHQDLYGPIHFPLQVVVQLSREGEEFSGGELVLVEQRPRMQSRPVVLHLEQGSAAIIPVRERPRQGVRGYHKAAMRHGVSEVKTGCRQTLGLIFHDAA